MIDVVDALSANATHRRAERVFADAGWTSCDAGDWAIALRSPDGMTGARISRFDPTGPYTAALYREAAHGRQVPQLFAHRRLVGGGDLQVMERLDAVDDQDAIDFHRSIENREESVAELVDIVRHIRERALRELPWSDRSTRTRRT